MDDEKPDLRCTMRVQEVSDLEDLTKTAIGYGGSLGWNTYVIKKLLVQLIKKIPEGKALDISSSKRLDREPDGYVYFVTDEDLEK
jgi:hypothetical protein